MSLNVVFDVGNVLIRWDPRNLYYKMFRDPAEMEWFLSHVCTGEWNLAQDRGRPWEDAIAMTVREHPRYEAEIRAFRSRWQEMLAGAIEANVRVLDTLRKNGVATYAITNFAADTFREAQELFPFLKGFDGIICSGEEKVCKPDPKIFQLLLERYHLKASSCVFIDDSDKNISQAGKLGFKTVHYGLGINAALAFRQFGLPAD